MSYLWNQGQRDAFALALVGLGLIMGGPLLLVFTDVHWLVCALVVAGGITFIIIGARDFEEAKRRD